MSVGTNLLKQLQDHEVKKTSGLITGSPARSAAMPTLRLIIGPNPFLPRDAMHKRGLCRHAVSVRLSVRLSVTFVNCVKTNKDIFDIFHRRIAKPF